jgi:hypothetical protein
MLSGLLTNSRDNPRRLSEAAVGFIGLLGRIRIGASNTSLYGGN